MDNNNARENFAQPGVRHETLKRVAVALRRRGLWPEPGGLTLRQLGEAKRLPPAFLESFGVREARVGGRPAVLVPYYDSGGEEVAVRLRVAIHGDRFRWRTGSKPTLYGLWRLQEVRESGWVLLVEGESDAWTCWLHGIPALGVPGKSTWRAELAQHLAGLDVILWCEPDALDLVERVARDVPNLRVIEAPAGTKDLSEAHVRGEDVRALVDRLTHEAEPAEVFFERKREEERRRRAAEALPLARQVLEAPDLWQRVREALRAAGVAGDLRPAELLYLALTSRLLHRPVNVALEGPSAAGKTWIASCVLQLFPADAVHRRAAMSERALVYSDADFRHRFLLVGEASGLHHDGVGATLLRTVAWEGRVVYETVEKTAAGLRARLVEKDGPTGVITTTTKALDEELATRFLIVPVPDDARQTEEVLRATAARFANSAAGADLRPFVEAQRWLELAGARQVTVPYAEALARLVDRSAVRVRRDFSQLLTLVAACALLHQLQRPRRGRAVVATLDDYRLVYELAGDLFSAAATLSEAQLEAVQAIRDLYNERQAPVTYQEVAQRLRLDRAAVRRRLARALREGFVVNEEPHPNRPARLRPGDLVPEFRRALPSPEELAAALGPDGPSGGPEDVRVGEHLDTDASHPEGPGEAQEISGGYPPKPLHAMHASRKPAQEANSGVQCPTARQLHASTPARHPPDPDPPPGGPPEDHPPDLGPPGPEALDQATQGPEKEALPEWAVRLAEELPRQPGTDPEAVARAAVALLEPPLGPEDLFSAADQAPPVEPCWCCRGRRWWLRPRHLGGGWVCVKCHPPGPVVPAGWHEVGADGQDKPAPPPQPEEDPPVWWMDGADPDPGPEAQPPDWPDAWPGGEDWWAA